MYDNDIFSGKILLNVEKVKFLIRFFLSLKSLSLYCSLVKNRLGSQSQFIL